MVRKFKNIIFGNCVWLLGVIFEPIFPGVLPPGKALKLKDINEINGKQKFSQINHVYDSPSPIANK